ncbi:MAG: ferritin-like domain-containing protein [Gaiellaceae bacterium]
MAQIADPKMLFAHKLGAALTMEETVLTMLNELEGKANDDELKQQLAHHAEETRGQIRNLQQAFSALGHEAQKQPCPAIEGLQTEGQQMLQQTSTELHDAVILSGCGEVEHHEIAVYDGLVTMADELDADDVVALLEENLEQEEHTLKEVEQAFEKQAKQLAKAAA